MIGVEEIQRRLPYRYPMLLLDQVLAIEPGRRITAVKAVAGGEPFVRDSPTHTLPRFALIESWAQSAALLTLWDETDPEEAHMALVGSIEDVWIGPPVPAGSLLEHDTRLVRRVGGVSILTGRTRVGTQTVLSVGKLVAAKVRRADIGGAGS